MSPGGEAILVTGGTGFLGRQVVRRLVGAGRAVRVLVRPGMDREAVRRLWGDTANDRVEVFPASFGDAEALARALEGVGIVLHVAASKAGSAAAQIANTVVGTDNLLQAVVEAQTPRFVLVGSLGVIGAAGLPRGATVDEQVPLEPHPEWRDPYTFAKHRQEQLAWKYHTEVGLPLVVVRPGVIFGPSQSLLNARVGLSLFGLFLHLGGRNPVPLTYVDNCADAIVRAGFADGVEGEAFCIVDDSLPTSRQLLRRYRREVRRIPFLWVPPTALRLLARLNVWYANRTNGHLPAVFTPYKVDAMWKRQHFSNEKAKRLLRWAPLVPMHEALSITIADESRRLSSQ